MTASERSTTIAVAEGTSVTAARPKGVTASDDLWAIHRADGESGSLDDMTAPAGWTLIGSRSQGGWLTKVWRKQASGGEPATQVFGQPPGIGVVIYTAATGTSTAITPVVAIANNTDFTSLTPSVDPAAAASLELRATIIATPSGTTFTFKAPSGYTREAQIIDTSVSQAVSAAVASRPVNSSAPSGTKAFTRTPSTTSLLSTGVSISIASADVEPTPEPPPPFTPARGTGKYQYVVRRLLDRAYLGHLIGLEQVSFERRISTAGTFTGRIPITNTKISDAVDACIPRDPAALNRGPGVIVVEVIREGEYWGEYWVTGATLAKDRRRPPTLELRGASLEAYFQHVRIRQDLEFTDVDQVEIARQLLGSMQAQSNANLGLILQTGTSGQTRTHTYKAADRTPYGQRLQELGEALDGFEWTIDTLNGTTGLDRSWRWGAPTIGNPTAAHVFGEGPYGGDVLAWRIEIDAIRGGTYWEARGDNDQNDASSSGEPRFSTLQAATAHLTAGWPRIDRVVDRPGVTRQATLNGWAQGWAARKSGAVRVFSVTVAIGKQPSFTPNNLGDNARFAMTDEWHKRTGSGAGTNQLHRVIGVRVVPVGRDQGKDEMEMIIASPEVT